MDCGSPSASSSPLVQVGLSPAWTCLAKPSVAASSKYSWSSSLALELGTYTFYFFSATDTKPPGCFQWQSYPWAPLWQYRVFLMGLQPCKDRGKATPLGRLHGPSASLPGRVWYWQAEAVTHGWSDPLEGIGDIFCEGENHSPLHFGCITWGALPLAHL